MKTIERTIEILNPGTPTHKSTEHRDTCETDLILALAHLSEHLTEVERILRDARHGKYEETHDKTDRAA